MKNLLDSMMLQFYLMNMKVSVGNFWIKSYKKYLESLTFKIECVINTNR